MKAQSGEPFSNDEKQSREEAPARMPSELSWNHLRELKADIRHDVVSETAGHFREEQERLAYQGRRAQSLLLWSSLAATVVTGAILIAIGVFTRRSIESALKQSGDLQAQLRPFIEQKFVPGELRASVAEAVSLSQKSAVRLEQIADTEVPFLKSESRRLAEE